MSPRRPQQHSSRSPHRRLPGRRPRRRPDTTPLKFSVHLADFRVLHRADALPVVHRPPQYPPSSGAALGVAGLSVGSSWSTPLRGITATGCREPQRWRCHSRGQNRTTRAISAATAALHVHARVDEPLRSVVLIHVRVLVILVVLAPGPSRGLCGVVARPHHVNDFGLPGRIRGSGDGEEPATARATTFEAVELLLAAYRRVVAAALASRRSPAPRRGLIWMTTGYLLTSHSHPSLNTFMGARSAVYGCCSTFVRLSA